jgi:hypothetical protein
MRILRSIVAPSTAFMAFCHAKMTGGSPIRSQVVCDQLVGDKAIFLQKLAHQFERRPLVPPGLHQHIEHFALGVDGAPEVGPATLASRFSTSSGTSPKDRFSEYALAVPTMRRSVE